MPKVDRNAEKLDESRKQRVRDNMGLVATHLSRNVRGLSGRGRPEAWDELFQEGCLGLIRAAKEFDERRGIPFAAFALPRIHRAVSKALHGKGAVIDPLRKRGRFAGAQDRHNPFSRTESLSALRTERMSLKSRRPPDAGAHPGDEAGDTVGARLRRKHDRAVQAAATAIGASAPALGDRRKIIRLITRDRLLVPDEASRSSLRAIADKTKSSFGRVVDCERRLVAAVRTELENDPEFVRLRRLAGTSVAGAELLVDQDVDRELAHAAADTFVARFREASRKDRARMIAELLDVHGGDLVPWIRGRFSTMPDEKRELIVRRTLRVPAETPRVTVDKGPACSTGTENS